jgi:hypothetical protein
MATRLDLAEALAGKQPVKFRGAPDSILYKDKTPAHTFTTVASLVPGGQFCVVVPSKDFFDEQLASDVIDVVRQRWEAISDDRNVTVLDRFLSRGYPFNTVFVLGPHAARQFEFENDHLSSIAFVAFPGFRCELSGTESAEEIEFIRSNLLPSLDWRRHPCPKVRLAFRNLRKQNWSKGKIPGLTTLKRVVEEIENLVESSGSWVVVENYAGRRYRIEWEPEQFRVTANSSTVRLVASADVVQLVREFVLRDT